MLQTPSRARVRSQDDGYSTPTSAHISRFQRGNIDQHQHQHQRIIPLLLPSVKSSALKDTWSNQPKSLKEINSAIGVLSNVQRAGTNSPRNRKKSGMAAEVTGFDMWHDGRDDAENINNAGSFGKSNEASSGDRSPYVLKSGWNSASKPRMGRRSLTFPGTEKAFVPVDVRMDSPARKRVNSDRSDISATRSPLRSVQPSAPTLNPPATPTPSSSQSTRPTSQSIQKTILAPPTPSRGGLRRKSKFIARQSVSRPAKHREEVEGATDTEDVEVEGVERGVQMGPRLGARTESWMTEAGAEVEEAIASQVSIDLEPGELSQLSQGTSASQEAVAASQATRLERRSESVVVEKTLRRSARLSAGRTSSSPRPGGPNDPFQADDVSAEPSHAVSTAAQNRPSTKVASPKPSARRRKRSSEVNSISTGSSNVTYESPNPRAKKNARKSVLVVEIPTSVSRLVGSPMQGVVRTSQGGNEAPVTPKRVTVAKRQVPATDRPVGKSSRATQSSSQASTRGKSRKSLGSQLDWMAENAPASSTTKRKKGRKSLAPASVVKDLHNYLDHPPRPSSPGEDVLLLVGVEETLETASRRARSRTMASNTPQPRKGNTKAKGKENSHPLESKAPVPISPEYQETALQDEAPDSSPHQPRSQSPALSPELRDYDAPPRSSSPAFPQIQDYSSPDSRWRSLEFSGFAAGACDSSPPQHSSPAQPRIWRIHPNMHDFAQATASTPLRTPLSKKRKSTPHHRNIPSSTPAPTEDALSERDTVDDESFDARPIDQCDNDYASDGDWAAGDRDSSPEYQDAADVTVQEGDETQRAPSNEPEASHGDWHAETGDISEGSREEYQAVLPMSQELLELPRGIGPQTTQPLEPDNTRTRPYITVRTVQIKLEDESEHDCTSAPVDQAGASDARAGSSVITAAATGTTPNDPPEQSGLAASGDNPTPEAALDNQAGKSSAVSTGTDHTATPKPLGKIASPSNSALQRASEDCVPQQTDTTLVQAPIGALSSTGAEQTTLISTEQPADQTSSTTEPSKADAKEDPVCTSHEQDFAVLSRAIDTEDDYTKIPIVISSQDPRAAALAAAVLRQSKRYAEIGSSNTETTNKLKRRRSQYFVSAEAASVLTPAELIKEAELELMDEYSERRQTEPKRRTTALAPTNLSSEDLDWNRDDWSVLNRCYRKTMKQKDAQAKRAESNLEDNVDVQAVIDLLVFKKGLTQAQLRDGKYNKTAMWNRITKLHRHTRDKAGRVAPIEATLSPTERSSSVAVAAMESVSPVVKKSKTSETVSRITKIEVHVDRKSSEVSSASSSGGWWGSVSSTWRRIKSSVSLASMQQTDEEEVTSGDGNIISSEQRKEVIEHIDAVFTTTDKEQSLRRHIARPRRALPGGLANLPIDTPAPMTSVHPGRLVTLDTDRRIAKIVSATRNNIADEHRLEGAGDANVSSTIEESHAGSTNGTPSHPILIPRSVMGSTTTSPRVKDLVRSFEDAAHRSKYSNGGDDTLRSTVNRSGESKQTYNSDSIRRKGAVYDSSPSNRRP